MSLPSVVFFFFFQAEDGIRDLTVTGVQTCALPICIHEVADQGPHFAGGVDFIDGDRDFLTAATAEGAVNVAGSIHGRVAHGMQVFRDGGAHFHRDGRAHRSPRVHGNVPAHDALGYLDDDLIRGTQQQAAELVTKAHHRTSVSVLREARSANGDFSARNGGTWRHSLDLRFTRASLFHRCV